ncbi:hypothetical protein BASA81_008643 [Batrachochytrium salamandrivorans]|nr:hypothetical protein BASA81_008643 [Batrachochytrium salamandrivorans]
MPPSTTTPPKRLVRRTSAVSLVSSVASDELTPTSPASAAAVAAVAVRRSSSAGEEEEDDDKQVHLPQLVALRTKRQMALVGALFLLVSVGTFLNTQSPTTSSPAAMLTGLSHSMACQAGKCSIKFTGQGVEHHVDLVPESRSLFADSLVVERDGEETIVTKDQRRHVMYETAPGAAEWGAGLVDLDTNTLVSGLFLTKDQQVIEHNIKANRHERALGEDEHVVMEMPGIGQPWLLPQTANRAAAKAQDTVLVSASKSGVVTPFFPDCFKDDAVTQVFKMNVAYDFGLASSFASTADALADLDVLFSVGKLIFLQQLNVRLEVNKVILGTANSAIPLNRGKAAGTCTNALGALPEIVSWANSQPRTGFTLLMSNCFSGITGTSYIGSVCSASLNANVAAHSWLVAFHELGHGFGMTHSFENGMGVTGGIMDYGDGLYNGVAQFHPNKRAEVCPFLEYNVPICPFLAPATLESRCGDGILTKDETCECLVQGTTSCGKCQKCQVSAGVECSAKDFLFRTQSMPDTVIVANAEFRSDAECCTSDNTLAAPKTTCGSGQVNACSQGKCTAICSQYLSYNNPNCGFDSTGCMLGCVYNNRCLFDLNFADSTTGQKVFVSALPEGTRCSMESGELGQCQSNTCVEDDAEKVSSESVGGEPVTTQTPVAPPTTFPTLVPCLGMRKKAACIKNSKCKWVKSKCQPKVAINKIAKRNVSLLISAGDEEEDAIIGEETEDDGSADAEY